MKPSTSFHLALDGGGERGLFQMVILQRFCTLWGIQQSQLRSRCTVLSGTSVGGLAALAIAKGMTPDDLVPFFTDIGPWLFTIRTAADVLAGRINASDPSNRPNTAQKLALMYDDNPFYEAVDPASNYGSSRLKAELDTLFGTMTLADLPVPVVIPAYDKTAQTFRLFSNIGTAPYIGKTELIKNVALATSAAPLYLPSAVFGGSEYLDGGVFQNNPASLGMTAAKNIKPSARKYCTLSVGTGLGALGFGDTPDLSGLEEQGYDLRAIESLKGLFELISIGITGCQETVRKDILTRSNQYNAFSNEYQLTYQDQLDEENWDTALDNTDPAFLQYLQDFANALFDNTIEDASAFISTLEG